MPLKLIYKLSCNFQALRKDNNFFIKLKVYLKNYPVTLDALFKDKTNFDAFRNQYPVQKTDENASESIFLHVSVFFSSLVLSRRSVFLCIHNVVYYRKDMSGGMAESLSLHRRTGFPLQSVQYEELLLVHRRKFDAARIRDRPDVSF